MIDRLEDFPSNILAFVCHGRVSKAEYDTVVVPAVESALKNNSKVRIYFETASDFRGFDMGAVWEDLKIGMKNLSRWERIAVVTDVEWIKRMVAIFSVLIPGKTKVLPAAEAAQARAWISIS
jgi:hypothetical protein